MEERDRAQETVPRRGSDPSRQTRPAPSGGVEEGGPAGAQQPEASEDFARRDIETAEEDPEEHDRRRHDRGRSDAEPSRPV